MCNPEVAVLSLVGLVWVIGGPTMAVQTCGLNTLGKVHCGDGFHSCNGDQACCSDIDAYPIEIALLCLGIFAVIISLGLMIFIIVTVLKSLKPDEERSNISDEYQLKISSIVQ